jgi:hypothetical protein
MIFWYDGGMNALLNLIEETAFLVVGWSPIWFPIVVVALLVKLKKRPTVWIVLGCIALEAILFAASGSSMMLHEQVYGTH